MRSQEPCPVCGRTEATEIFRFLRPRPRVASGKHTEDAFGRAGRLLRCTGCGLVRQAELVEAPYEEQDDEEYLREETGIRTTFRDILRTVERFRAPPGRLLDVGSGPGFLVEEAKLAGWDAVGIEPSDWAREQAAQRGLAVLPGTLEEADVAAGSFDVVVAADVIEHVPEPDRFTDELRKVLRPNGVAFIATPNVASPVAKLLRRWWWSVIPNHLWLFTPDTLARLLRQHGLEPLWTATHPKTFSVSYYAGRLGGYSGAVGTTVQRVARALGGDRLITPDFRDRVCVIARRVDASAGQTSST